MMAASSIAVRWPHWRRTRRCSSICSVSVWRATNERRSCASPQGPRCRAFAGAAAAGGGRAAGDELLHLAHPHRRRRRHGHDAVPHGLGPDADLRPDGRAQFRARRLHHAGRLCRGERAWGVGGVERRRVLVAQPGGALGRARRRHRRQRYARLCLRARHHPPRLRCASAADPRHRGRAHRRRAAHRRAVGTESAAAAQAGELPRQHHPGRRRDREIPDHRRRAGARRLSRAALRPQPHAHRPPGARRGREPRDGRGARLPHPSALHRRVRRRHGARRDGRGDVGRLPGARHPRHRCGYDNPGVHHPHHRRSRLGRRLLRRRAAGRAPDQLCRLPRAQGGARLQYHADGGDPAVASARPLPGGEGMSGGDDGTRGRLDSLLSGDRPGSIVLSALMLAVLIGLALTPFLFPGTRSVAVAARICIFVVLAASYDVMLGYTGIVSFAHTMFFGIGAYGVAIALAKFSVGWGAVLLGAAAGVALAIVLAAAIGLLSLRVRAIFFSMITLAVASFAQILATQLRDVTGGEDGLTFSVPRVLTPGFRLLEDSVLGVRIDGRLITYYLIFAVSLALFLLMLRIVNSPFGRVLQAIRENAFRAEALGYRTVVYRTLAGALSAAMAALAGAMMAVLLRYNGPAATLSFDLMVDILLMAVIGGMGTLYGPALGAVVLGMVGQLENSLMPWRISGSESTSTPLNFTPICVRICTTAAEKPHCGKTGVPFM